MDYAEFKRQLGEDADILTDEFAHNSDGIHVVVYIGEWNDKGFVAYPDIPGQIILEALKLVEERGGVRGKDYLISCSYTERPDGRVRVSLHTTHKFLSDEDFDPNIKRIWREVGNES